MSYNVICVIFVAFCVNMPTNNINAAPRLCSACFYGRPARHINTYPYRGKGGLALI